MASNSFGEIFRITTFGESHGPGIGVVIDGCPAGLSLSKEEIESDLQLRRPGKNGFTSPRIEEDSVDILSGVFNGQTTGAPIALWIRNQDSDASQYKQIQDLYRPGHANFTYLEKYGVFDHRGGGRASARETAARVAAAAVAKKLLALFHVECAAYIDEIGGIAADEIDLQDLKRVRMQTYASPIYCPDQNGAIQMMERIDAVKEEGDSLGAIVACAAQIPVGWGDPVYRKLEAQLASAMLSLPATKGFEIGSGFSAARMKGSEHNDPFDLDEEQNVITTTNHAGGTLGGISNGSILFFRVAFKPTSSIQKRQQTVSIKKEKADFQLPSTGRHDPCVAIRAVPIVEAMTSLVLADAMLMNRCAKI